MDRYVKIKPLGKGSFGSAILIRRRSDNQLLVVKEVNLSKMSPKEREEARNECKVLHQLNHPNIVRYMEHYEHHGVLYIIMEYADGGDLAQKLKQNGGRGLSEDTIMYYFSQLCLALEYLHSRHILHRDIKTMNVFLMKNGAVKLGDFGISTILRNTMGMANTVCGTPYYFSPELCKNKPYNNRSDIWALGVVLYELMTGKHPFDANSMQQLMQRIVKSSYAPAPSTYSKELRQLLDICLQKEAMRRPTIKQLLGFPIVRRALETLETDLMLATQCRVRLQDIIDFPAKNHADKGSNTATPVPPTQNPPSAPTAQPDAIVVRDDPRSARAAAKSPPPVARHGVLAPPPSSGLQPAQMHPQPQVAVHAQGAAQGAGNAGISNQLRADLDRVDAFIRQLNQPVQDRAKDAIQEYMRRKQEELAERKKREAEMQKKQEERNQELKKIMEDHQRQMLEHARLKQQRVSQAQQNPAPTHLAQAAQAAASEVTPSEARRQSKARQQQPPPPPAGAANHPSVLQQMYGRVSPRRRPKAIAANSPAYARQMAANPKGVVGQISPTTGNLVLPVPPAAAAVGVAAPLQPQQHASPGNSKPHAGHMYVDVPMGAQQRHQVAERAQQWVDRQAEKRRAELDARHQRKLDDDRKMVRDLDAHQHQHAQQGPVPSLVNKVVDPELEAWVRRTTAAPDVIGHRRESRSLSPSAVPTGAHDDVPAGVDARRRATSTPPLSFPTDAALLRHVHAVDAVFREQQVPHQHHPTALSSRQPQRYPAIPASSIQPGSSPSLRPRTPPVRDGAAPVEFRRRHADGSSQPASSRSSSAASDAAMRIPAPADVPDDRRLPLQERSAAMHTGPLTAAMQPRSEAKLTAHPMVRYASAPETLLEDEEDEITVPEIIRSFRGPSLEDEFAAVGRDGSSGVMSKSPEPEVPVEAYERMLDHLKHVLDKKPVSSQATRHHVALLDADVLSESDAEVVDTEEELFRRTGDEGEEDEESDADDFADEEPITPPHLSRTAGGEDGGATASPDDDDDDDDDDDEGDLEEEPNLAGDYRFHQLCGRSFRGQCATNPATGRSLFPVTSVSRQTNEFQLRSLLEKRLGVVALDSVVAQLEALPVVRRSPSDGTALGLANSSVQEVRSAVATYLAKMKRCPTAAIGQAEVSETLALVAQLLFFRDA